MMSAFNRLKPQKELNVNGSDTDAVCRPYVPKTCQQYFPDEPDPGPGGDVPGGDPGVKPKLSKSSPKSKVPPPPKAMKASAGAGSSKPKKSKGNKQAKDSADKRPNKPKKPEKPKSKSKSKSKSK